MANQFESIMRDLRVLLARYELDHIGMSYHYTKQSVANFNCEICKEAKALLKELEDMKNE
jgi:hypothetical protein